MATICWELIKKTYDKKKYSHLFGQWHSPEGSTGKYILTTQNYQFSTDDEYSLNQHYLLVSSACKTITLVGFKIKGGKTLKNTMPTDLEVAKTEFIEK